MAATKLAQRKYAPIFWRRIAHHDAHLFSSLAMASNSTNTSSASSRSSRSKPSSNRRGRTSSGSSGAAAEPEPSEVPSTRAAAATTGTTTTYNVRDYQNPDAGADDQALSKAAKGKTKAKGEKGGGATTFVCFNCGRTAPKLLRCSQCHHAHYCGPEVRPT